MVTLNIALLSCLVVPPQDDLATRVRPAEIESAYKALPGFKDLQWTREDRPDLVLLVEKSERKELKYLVEVRAWVLADLRTRLARDLGKLGLELGPRPLVVWLCKDAQRAASLARRGEVFDGYERAARHVLCAPGSDNSAEPDAIQSLVRGATLALLDGATLKGAAVTLSDWIRFGLAAHYATRPAGPILLKSDPLLGTLSGDLFSGMFDLAKRPPPLEKLAKFPRHHHPMTVALFATLGEYLQACGATEGDAQQAQTRRFLDHAHLLGALFLRGFGGGLQPALREIVAAEAAGKHGDASFSGTFAGELRREKLANLTAVFAANAKAASEQDLPEGTVVTAGAAAADASGSSALAKFAEPPGEALPETAMPAEAALARALLAGLDLLPEDGLKLLEGQSGKDVEAIATALGKEKELLATFAQKLAGADKPTLFLPDPEKPKDLVQFSVVEFKLGERTLKLKRGGKELTWLTRWIPPQQLGDSLVRAKVPLDDGAKAALGLLTAVFTAGKPDQKDQLARARRNGIVAVGDLADRIAPMTQMVGLADKLAQDVESSGDGQKALAAFEAGIKAVAKAGPHEKQAAKAALVPLLPRLWATGAFLAGSLRGKCTPERGGKVRLEYHWKNAAELNDWLTVDPAKDEFQPWGAAFTGGKASVADDKLVMEGPLVLRHKLQMEGDMEVNLLGAGIEEETEEGTHRTVHPEPLLGIYARPGGHMIVMNCYGAMALMKRGVAEGDKGARQEEFGELFAKALSDATGFTLRRSGNNVTVKVGGTEVCKVAAPADYANVGGIVLIHRGAEKVVCDRVVVVGKLMPGTGAALMGTWAKGVLGRL